MAAPFETARKGSTASAEMQSPTTATNEPSSPTQAAETSSQPPATGPSAPRDRRMSDEWDAAKVPPSRFQKRKGSIFGVPSSRDGRIDRNYAAEYYEKLAEMGYAPKKKE
ncbi:uncharacterized protein CTHT_0033870 [Thermochaetoides thermophila DSM 1495]|uniref:Uncharacterized protein n=1 Tax=Chaetomium thermophilum (strain DSM 1495 / CBS 144.50 / IMI 039719) TaxID=759272 RepID=G0S5W5_CHATD|nr:hypothetical protein CTHT_0033870 [Thermochaetoides thermophila DSM 1495]EGS21527.1 hypothetical protein CTHT_0033870 [Thermochaetoides thermophila DSM 1495]